MFNYLFYSVGQIVYSMKINRQIACYDPATISCKKSSIVEPATPRRLASKAIIWHHKPTIAFIHRLNEAKKWFVILSNSHECMLTLPPILKFETKEEPTGTWATHIQFYRQTDKLFKI